MYRPAVTVPPIGQRPVAVVDPRVEAVDHRLTMRRADAGHVRKNVVGTGRGGLDRMLGCPEPTVPGLDQRMRERALRREGITGRETAVLCRARDSKEKRGRPAQSRYMPLAAAPYFGE